MTCQRVDEFILLTNFYEFMCLARNAVESIENKAFVVVECRALVI